MSDGNRIYYKDGKGLRIKFYYDEHVIKDLKKSVSGIMWDKESKIWTIPYGTVLDDTLIQNIKDFAKRHYFNIEESAGKYLGITGNQVTTPEIKLEYNSRDNYDRDSTISVKTMDDKQNIAFKTPFSNSMVSYFRTQVNGSQWDSDSKQWLVPVEDLVKLNKIIEKIKSVFPEKVTKHEQVENEFPGSYIISTGEGYGGRPYQIGEILRDGDKGIVKVISAKSTYFKSDGMSFGVGDERGYIYSARVIPVTEEEQKPLIEQEFKIKISSDATNRAKNIIHSIEKGGNLPREAIPYFPDGEEYFNDGYQRIIIEPNKYIWSIRDNGADGDDWGNTNIGKPGYAGYIGFRVPYNKALEHEIVRLSEIKNNPKMGDILPETVTILDLPTKSNNAAVAIPDQSLTELREINSERSNRSKAADNPRRNQIIIDHSNPAVRRWKRDPGSMDVLGVDTPPGITQPTRGISARDLRISQQGMRLTSRAPRITPRRGRLK